MLLEHETNTALPRLAVHSNRLFVRLANIARIYGQIGDFPAVLIDLRHALADRVLVGSGKCREHQVAGIWVTFVHRQLVNALDGAAN